jgi:hypothetical protein
MSEMNVLTHRHTAQLPSRARTLSPCGRGKLRRQQGEGPSVPYLSRWGRLTPHPPPVGGSLSRKGRGWTTAEFAGRSIVY